MTPEQLSKFAPHPPSVAEWEDLLVRLEIMPRALRANLEEAGARGLETEWVLRELVERETAAGAWLERAVTGEEPRDADGPGVAGGGAEDLAGRFVRVRARNFAMVQRRGVQIWGWSAETPDGYTPTVHQVLAWLAENDAHALAHLRQGTRRTGAGGPEAPC
jgi:hypothetical protein